MESSAEERRERRRRRWARRARARAEVESVVGPLRRYARGLGFGRPPGRLFVASSVALGAASVVAAMGPLGLGEIRARFALSWLVLVAIWGARFLAVAAARSARWTSGLNRLDPKPVQRRAARTALLRWTATPGVAAAAMLGCAALPLERFGFEVSRQPFDRMAREATAHPERFPVRWDVRRPVQWLGIVPVTRVEPLSFGVRFTTREGWFYEGGFVYCGDGRPVSEPEKHDTPMGDGWWRWDDRY